METCIINPHWFCRYEGVIYARYIGPAKGIWGEVWYVNRSPQAELGRTRVGHWEPIRVEDVPDPVFAMLSLTGLANRSN